MNNELFSAVDDYIAQLVNPADEALQQAQGSAAAENIPAISVSANQGRFLEVLARSCGAKRILEIGTLVGYSTIWMAKALPPTGKLITLELEPTHAAVAQRNFERAGLSSKIEIRVGAALTLLANLHAANEAPFDMIFIDADKPPYVEYFEWALKLSRPGTLIVADNVIRDGKVLDPNCDDPMVQGAQRFNKALGASKAVTATILQTVGNKEYDGMAIAVVN